MNAYNEYCNFVLSFSKNSRNYCVFDEKLPMSGG